MCEGNGVRFGLGTEFVFGATFFTLCFCLGEQDFSWDETADLIFSLILGDNSIKLANDPGRLLGQICPTIFMFAFLLLCFCFFSLFNACFVRLSIDGVLSYSSYTHPTSEVGVRLAGMRSRFLSIFMAGMIILLWCEPPIT